MPLIGPPATSSSTWTKSPLAGMPTMSGYVDDPICAANGNFVHVEDDLYLPGWSAVLDVTRTYNSVAVPVRYDAAGRQRVVGRG